jgi:hypothetical protein
MEEIKQRKAVITNVLSLRVPLPKIIAFELCFLQLRMTCELIALGCLVAHGDLSAVKSKHLKKAYNPNEIIKELQRLHFDFYPVPKSWLRLSEQFPANDKWCSAGFRSLEGAGCWV